MKIRPPSFGENPILDMLVITLIFGIVVGIYFWQYFALIQKIMENEGVTFQDWLIFWMIVPNFFYVAFKALTGYRR